MLTFLFWNLNRKPLQDIVANIAREHAADIVILAESGARPGQVLQALNGRGSAEFHYPENFSRRIEFFTRFSRGFFIKRADGPRYAIRRLYPGVFGYYSSRFIWQANSMQARKARRLEAPNWLVRSSKQKGSKATTAPSW